MRITKGKPHVAKTERAEKAATKKTATKKAEPKKAEQVERMLIEEVAGTHASAAKLKKIVERVLGGGEDSDVRALVTKLAQAARTNPPAY